MENVKKYKKIIVSGFLTVGIILISFIYYLNEENPKNSVVYAQNEIMTTENKEKENNSFYVDIKGSVKKPGVYLVTNGNIVQDVINLAGGLKSGASTSNINLAEKVKEEMVIYIFSKKELSKESNSTLSTTTCTTNVIEINKCDPITTQKIEDNNHNNDKETSPIQNKLVNINTASKEELMTIPNIGSSKADAIIIYRSEKKFNSIEEIMNVSGIGESVFVKIKEHITI